jgi:hypothetical protein
MSITGLGVKGFGLAPPSSCFLYHAEQNTQEEKN